VDVLLDTCSVIWAAAEPVKLSPRVTKILTAKDTQAWVSVISCAELACLTERGRIQLDRHWKKWFRDALETNAWNLADLDLRIMEEAYSLPGSYHRDPVDRIIAATARLRQLTILTADEKILQYPHVESLW
jgi:PIN domain nuclease of toxin-antitoxin system